MSNKNSARLAAMILLATSLFSTAVAQQPEQPAEDPPVKRLYVALYSRGPGFIEDVNPREQPGIDQHVVFIQGMYAADVVPLGGPLIDDDARTQISGILYFVRARNLREAREIALREPMLETRVIELVSVREFLTGVGEGRLNEKESAPEP